MTDELKAFIREMDMRFSSGNSVPVDTARIKGQEWEAIRPLLMEHALAERAGVVPDDIAGRLQSIAADLHGREPDTIDAIFEVIDVLNAAPPAPAIERTTHPGWRLVPEVPTQEMCQQGQWKAQEWPRFPLRISPIYQAMLAAAPEAPKP